MAGFARLDIGADDRIATHPADAGVSAGIRIVLVAVITFLTSVDDFVTTSRCETVARAIIIVGLVTIITGFVALEPRPDIDPTNSIAAKRDTALLTGILRDLVPVVTLFAVIDTVIAAYVGETARGTPIANILIAVVAFLFDPLSFARSCIRLAPYIGRTGIALGTRW